jgi:hypothetical protein
MRELISMLKELLVLLPAYVVGRSCPSSILRKLPMSVSNPSPFHPFDPAQIKLDYKANPMEPIEFPEAYAEAMEKWYKKNAPDAEFFAIFKCIGNKNHKDFVQLLKSIKVPFYNAMGADIICFYTEKQNGHMLTGVKMMDIQIGLMGWGLVKK